MEGPGTTVEEAHRRRRTRKDERAGIIGSWVRLEERAQRHANRFHSRPQVDSVAATAPKTAPRPPPPPAPHHARSVAGKTAFRRVGNGAPAGAGVTVLTVPLQPTCQIDVVVNDEYARHGCHGKCLQGRVTDAGSVARAECGNPPLWRRRIRSGCWLGVCCHRRRRTSTPQSWPL